MSGGGARKFCVCLEVPAAWNECGYRCTVGLEDLPVVGECNLLGIFCAGHVFPLSFLGVLVVFKAVLHRHGYLWVEYVKCVPVHSEHQTSGLLRRHMLIQDAV